MSSLSVLYTAAQARMSQATSLLLSSVSKENHPQQPTSKKRKRQQSDPKRNQPKRDRAPASYAEIDSDDELIYRSDEEFDCPHAVRKKQKPLPKRKVFPFFSLPREIRDMIYEACLIDSIGGAYIEERTIHYRRTPKRVAAGPESFMANWGSRCRNGALPAWPHPDDHHHHYHYRRNHDDDGGGLSTPPPPHSQTLVPALLLACKQAHAEAAPLLYGQPLYFEDGRALHGFLAALSPATRALLRHVTVLEDHRWRSLKKNFDVAAFTLLAEGATGLKSLRLADMMGQWLERPEEGARRFYRRAFRWLEAVRRREGGIDEAVALVQVVDRDFEVWSAGDEGAGREAGFWEELRRLMAESAKNW